MRKLLASRRPSPAMVIACVALFAALGGTANALSGKNSIDKNDLRKNVVASKNIKKRAVTASKIRTGNVTTSKLKANAVDVTKLADGAVNVAKLADGSVSTAKLGDGAVTGGKLSNGAVGASKISGTVIRTADSAPFNDVDGSNNAGQVGSASVTASCNQGEVLLSGGAEWTTGDDAGENYYIRESFPQGNSWVAVGNADAGAQGNVVLRAHAICLQP